MPNSFFDKSLCVPLSLLVYLKASVGINAKKVERIGLGAVENAVSDNDALLSSPVIIAVYGENRAELTLTSAT